MLFRRKPCSWQRGGCGCDGHTRGEADVSCLAASTVALAAPDCPEISPTQAFAVTVLAPFVAKAGPSFFETCAATWTHLDVSAQCALAGGLLALVRARSAPRTGLHDVIVVLRAATTDNSLLRRRIDELVAEAALLA
eukprot:m.7818 g.7818  ORF g.7818 m.7818 type:complete len:137 (+) comp2222_c0_seq2:2200-2610(+)